MISINDVRQTKAINEFHRISSAKTHLFVRFPYQIQKRKTRWPLFSKDTRQCSWRKVEITGFRRLIHPEIKRTTGGVACGFVFLHITPFFRYPVKLDWFPSNEVLEAGCDRVNSGVKEYRRILADFQQFLGILIRNWVPRVPSDPFYDLFPKFSLLPQLSLLMVRNLFKSSLIQTMTSCHIEISRTIAVFCCSIPLSHASLKILYAAGRKSLPLLRKQRSEIVFMCSYDYPWAYIKILIKKKLKKRTEVGSVGSAAYHCFYGLFLWMR